MPRITHIDLQRTDPKAVAQRARDEQVRLAAQRTSTIVEIENDVGDRINVQPADVALWRSRGWRVVPHPIP